ncbi:flagellar assembly protein FliH [Aquincola tertiaricarbonis]|uniref:Flagellar assembly protein FliH n=1 Tax=Aquincola tertiaricarbonis TaxID=391953 RepID=A0ABY4S3S0_AQUTE|nr:FliH/SctL family protein [Aquincola tertiaricarbonis]URI06005.1 flagellar assembly protein FliH [Aquincola tertiaricarbonis]
MTTSSKDDAPKPPAGGNRPASSYARFIPREELQGFAAWRPDSFGSGFDEIPASLRRAPEPPPAPPPPEPMPEPAPAAPAGPTMQELQAAVAEARQGGYQDGYRDGLVALEGFKQSFAQQTMAQVGQLVNAFQAQLDALEQQLAATVAATATQLARQVVRAEVSTRPELVARVAEEAVNAVLLSARHIRVFVNPDDLSIVASGAAEALEARGARLMPSSQVLRGGCLIESDVGRIDARIDSRWAQAAAVLGQDVPYEGEA